MAYIYESTQPGLFNFSIPGQDKTVQLFKGSRVTVETKLAGGLLRVLRLVGETETEAPITTQETTKPKAKVADKITKVEEVVETPVETVEVTSEDTVVAVKEEETPVVTTPTPKKGRRKSTK